jgi:hypothetical protein
MNIFKHFFKIKLIYPILNNDIIKILFNIIIIFLFNLFYFLTFLCVDFVGVVTGVVVADVVVAGVADAPHIALCVVESHFAIAITGALNTLLEVESAVTDEASFIKFLVESSSFGLESHVSLKSSKSAFGF